MNLRCALLISWIVAAVGCGGGGGSASPTAPTAPTLAIAGSTTITPSMHPLGVCGVTTADSLQTPTLTPIVIPDGDPLSGLPWHYCMKAFGVSLLAVEKFSEPLLRHVTAVTAEYLDNNEDGLVDDPTLNSALVENYATMYLVDAIDKFSQFDQSSSSAIHLFKVTVAQHTGETNPLGTLCGSDCGTPTDVTLEEVLHLIQQAGYAVAHPDLSMDAPSLLTEAMVVSQASGWYDSDGNDCFGACAPIEYFYWGLTSLLGAQGHPARCSKIAAEWELCTRAKIQANDTKLYALLTNPTYNLPSVLPNGQYR